MMAAIDTLAARAVARLLDNMIALAADELPAIEARREDDTIVLGGRGLGRRRIDDARLRGLAAMAARIGA